MQSSDSALDWGWEVIHNPGEDWPSQGAIVRVLAGFVPGFLWQSSPNYSRSWGWDLTPENSSGAKGKKIPQLAARGSQPLHKNLHSCGEFGKIFLPQSPGSY